MKPFDPLFRDPDPIVLDPNEPAGQIEVDADVPRSCVQTVLDELGDRLGKSGDDGLGTETVDEEGRKGMDGWIHRKVERRCGSHANSRENATNDPECPTSFLQHLLPSSKRVIPQNDYLQPSC